MKRGQIWSRWWFQNFFDPYLGKWSNLTNIFSIVLKPPTSGEWKGDVFMNIISSHQDWCLDTEQWKKSGWSHPLFFGGKTRNGCLEMRAVCSTQSDVWGFNFLLLPTQFGMARSSLWLHLCSRLFFAGLKRICVASLESEYPSITETTLPWNAMPLILIHDVLLQENRWIKIVGFLSFRLIRLLTHDGRKGRI